MHKFFTFITLAVVFTLSPQVHADNADDAKAIIEKAIKARGDKPDSKFTAMTWKDSGKFSGGGLKIPYTAEWSFQAPDKYRFTFAAKVGDANINMLVVVNGDKAWGKDGDKVEEFTGDKKEQIINEGYQFLVTSLTPLVKDKNFKLSTAKGKEVEGRPTNAVKVEHDMRPAMTLYFDKQTNLLVKREIMVKDEFQQWKEVLDEATFSDYKTVDGKQVFTKLTIVRDGKTMVETTLSEIKDHEKLDETLFEMP